MDPRGRDYQAIRRITMKAHRESIQRDHDLRIERQDSDHARRGGAPQPLGERQRQFDAALCMKHLSFPQADR